MIFRFLVVTAAAGALGATAVLACGIDDQQSDQTGGEAGVAASSRHQLVGDSVGETTSRSSGSVEPIAAESIPPASQPAPSDYEPRPTPTPGGPERVVSDQLPPSPPENLTVKAEWEEKAALRWDHPHESTVDKYEILRRSVNDEEPFTKIAAVEEKGRGYYVDVDGLSFGKTYDYVVRAINESGTSGDSNVARVELAEGPKHRTELAAPANLTAKIESGSVLLEWDPPPGSERSDQAEIVGYEILRKRVSDRGFDRHVRNTKSTETVHLDAEDLDPSTEYVYAVRVLTAEDRSPTSDHALITTPRWGFDEPQEVTGFAAEARDGGVALSWDQHDDHSIDEFLIERVDVESGVGHAISLLYADRGHIFYFDDGVEPGKTYEYVIKAANHHGAGYKSEPVRVTVVSPSH